MPPEAEANPEHWQVRSRPLRVGFRLTFLVIDRGVPEGIW
jgi:hypothetical protein